MLVLHYTVNNATQKSEYDLEHQIIPWKFMDKIRKLELFCISKDMRTDLSYNIPLYAEINAKNFLSYEVDATNNFTKNTMPIF